MAFSKVHKWRLRRLIFVHFFLWERQIEIVKRLFPQCRMHACLCWNRTPQIWQTVSSQISPIFLIKPDMLVHDHHIPRRRNSYLPQNISSCALLYHVFHHVFVLRWNGESALVYNKATHIRRAKTLIVSFKLLIKTELVVEV